MIALRARSVQAATISSVAALISLAGCQAEKMSPPVPALSSSAVQSYSDGQLHWIIQNGVSPSGMPASKDVFRDEEIWQLVLYIRHLPPQGSLGEPSVYGGGESPQVIKTR
jgi:hypothetical protein